MSSPPPASDRREQELLVRYDELTASLTSEIEAALASADEWPDQVWAALAGGLDFLAKDPVAARLLCVDAPLAGPTALRRHQASLAALAAALSSGRGHYPKAQALPVATERVLVAGVLAAVAESVLAGEGADLAELAPDLAEAILAPYIGPHLWRRAVRRGVRGRVQLRELSESGASFRPLPSGHHQISAEQVATDQRQRVLHALTEGLGSGGYGQLTVDWLATRARISKRTFYELFGDKDGCVLAAYEDAEQRLWEAGTAAAAAESGWAAQMIAALAAVLAFFAAEPAAVHLFAGEVEVADAAIAARHHAAEQRLIALLRGARQAYPQADELPAVAEAALLENLTAVIYSYVQRGEAERLPTLAPQLSEMVLSSYMGTREAERLVSPQAA